MSGLNPWAIFEGLAAQIGNNLGRGTSVHACDPGDHTYPAIILEPQDPFFAYFGTMGPDGLSDMMLDLIIEVVAVQRTSAFIATMDYLAAGTGNNSSVIDAVHIDRTIGGLVDDCVCLTAGKPIEDDDGVLRTRLPVRIMVHKQNAEV